MPEPRAPLVIRKNRLGAKRTLEVRVLSDVRPDQPDLVHVTMLNRVGNWYGYLAMTRDEALALATALTAAAQGAPDA